MIGYEHHFPRHLSDEQLLEYATGKRVYTSWVLTTPIRKHIKKEWMTDKYHFRIQKKWNKRFGDTPNPDCIMTADALFFHPATLKIFAARIRHEHMLFK